MQSFKLKGRYTVANCNNRKETHGDEKVLAIDLKLSGYASVRDLVPILGVASEKDAAKTLWKSDETLELSLLNIAKVIPMDTKFESLCGKVGQIQFSDGVASKFVLEPSAGGGTLTFNLSIPHPDDKQIAKCAQMIAETHKISVEPMQKDLGEGEDDDPPF